MIPPIIHQTGPADKMYWHPVWFEGQKEWKRLYPYHIHYTWNDEQVDNFIEHNYPQYWQKYNSIPYHILKIDISRLFILHFYGGIYADLDYIPKMNFTDELHGDFCIVEAIAHGEIVQNSLMAASVLNPNILLVIDKLFEDYYNIPVVDNEKGYEFDDYVRKTFGPIGLSRTLPLFGDNFQILDQKLYNPNFLNHGDNIRGKHMLTGLWGDSNLIKQTFSNAEEYMKEALESYKERRCLDYTHYKPGDNI